VRIIDEAVLDLFRGVACEICGRPGSSEPHHVSARGMGSGKRLDVAINLLAVCRRCHTHIESGNIRRRVVLAVVADRERMTVDLLEQSIWQLQREP